MATTSAAPNHDLTSSPTTTTASTSTSTQTPIELSIPLPNAPGSRIHIHLTTLATSLLLFITNSHGDSSSAAALGSFVYAMPDRYNPTQPISTPLYTLPSSLDFATRLSKVLARRTQKPVYVGSSVSFANTGNGGTVEEEMEGFRRVVETVLGAVKGEEKA